MNKYEKAARALNASNVSYDSKGVYIRVGGHQCVGISEAEVDAFAEEFDNKLVNQVAQNPPTIFRMGMVWEAQGVLHLHEDQKFVEEALGVLPKNFDKDSLERLLQLIHDYRDNYVEDSECMNSILSMVGVVN
jgi:hypothetical protein